MGRRLAVAVACSGGRDSLALLHATVRAARPLGIAVHALHVHHGLMPQADGWRRHVEAVCERWSTAGSPVTCHAWHAQGAPGAGESVEAWAREVRYRGLAELARSLDLDLVLLGHHRRDQAETFLLQALRGGGVAGLASMAPDRTVDGVRWVRPWLAQARDAVDAYAAAHALDWVDDPSNADLRFGRNRLRHAVWPVLTAAFPGAEVALGAAARWAHDAHQALTELADMDLATSGDVDGLDLAAWSGLSDARRANALRHWWARVAGAPPPATLVVRLLAELPSARPGRWPCPGGTLRRHRGRLCFVPGPPASVGAAGDGTAAAQGAVAPVAPEARLAIDGPGRYALPGWRGVLVATAVSSGGVPTAWLGRLDLRPRSEGLAFQAGAGRPARSLKKQFQAAGVPAWHRAGPCVFSGGQLVYVPGLGVDARVVAFPGQPQLLLEWVPDDVSGR